MKTFLATFVVLSLVWMIHPPMIQAGPADLDLAFNADGKVLTDFDGGSDIGRSIALQSDGKIIVAGKMLSSITSNDFAVARYHPDGSLDSGFGTPSTVGRVSTDFTSSDDEGFAIAVQSDGKIIVAGSSDSDGSYDFALARYNADGDLDTTFGGNGKVITDFLGDSDEARAVLVQPDGKIVAVGTMFGTGNGSDFALVRYNPDGDLDISFGVNGKVNTDFPGTNDDEAFAAVLQPDGKIVVVGRHLSGTDTDFALARYNPDGSLDNTFDFDGLKITDFSGFDDEAYDVALQPDGKIVAAGGTSNGTFYSFAAARYNSDASLDLGFSFDGKVANDFGEDFAEAISVVVQPGGKIVVAGVSSAAAVGNFGLIRYEADGSLDGSFDFDGRVLTDFGGNDGALGVALQPDGKIVAAGVSIDGSGSADFAVARYLGDPAPPCLYCDDFQDGVLAPDWTYAKPQWTESGGNLIGSPAGKKAEALASPAFAGCSECIVQATMSTAGGPSNKVWLLGWYVDKHNAVEVLMKEESDKWILKQRSGGALIAKLKAAATILPNVNYEVQVTFNGASLSLIVDGVLLASTPVSAAPTGTVGFRVKNTTGSFGSVAVN